MWELSPIHDGAVRLKSTIRGFEDLEPQLFSISHSGHGDSYEDLTLRIGDLIHSRLHRIRYLWPYQAEPTVIRDVAFDLPTGAPAKIERITWRDPRANLFDRDQVFDASIVGSDYFTFRLELLDNGGSPADLADPLSRVAYRVALVRPSRETGLLKVFTGIYVLLMLLAAVLAAVEQQRRAAVAAADVHERPKLAMVTG